MFKLNAKLKAIKKASKRKSKDGFGCLSQKVLRAIMELELVQNSILQKPGDTRFCG
jgi:hypothetical protein